MKSMNMRKQNYGIGLIEILVSTVVIALGLLAVASMQANFYSTSADTKARGEAQVLAEQTVENLRNYLDMGDYNAIVSSANNQTIGGVNETFTRSWTVTNLTNPTRKQIDVTVSWGAAGSDQQIVLSTEIAYTNPAGSVALANFGDASLDGYGEAPNPNQNASETVDEIVDLLDNNGNVLLNGFSNTSGLLYSDGSTTYRLNSDGKTGTLVYQCNTLVSFEADLTNPENYDNSGNLLNNPSHMLYFTRSNQDGTAGDEVVELYTENYTVTTSGNNTVYTYDGTCTKEHRYFGGIIIPIRGTVHTLFNLNEIKIDHNKEDMYCAFYAGENQTSQPYACYVGGSCANSAAGINSSTDPTVCPSTANTADTKVGPGGFSGNVGLINVDDFGGGKESVCYADDLDGSSSGFSTARKYKTINASAEQGINQSFNCQDFLIVGRQANESKLQAECSAQASSLSNLNLPPKEVVRNISGTNTVQTLANNAYCAPLVPTTYTITVDVHNESPDGTSTVETGDGSPCVHVSNSDYLCTVTTTGTSIKINASNNNYSYKTGSCTINNLSNTTDCDIYLTTPPKYILNGAITGTNNTNNVTVTATDYINTVNCSFTSSTYSCTIYTNEPSVRIEINKQNKNDSCNKNELSGSSGTTTTFNNVCTLAL